jgi:hypothetical protein
MKVFKANNFVGTMVNRLRFIFEDYGRFRKEIDISLYGVKKKPPIGSGPIYLAGRVKIWVGEETIVDYRKESILNLIETLKEEDKETKNKKLKENEDRGL